MGAKPASRKPSVVPTDTASATAGETNMAKKSATWLASVKLIGSSRDPVYTEEGVVIEDHDWHRTVLPCDDVAAAFGMRKNDALLNALREVMPDVYAVGDCNEVKNIKNANQIAFNLALDL